MSNEPEQTTADDTPAAPEATLDIGSQAQPTSEPSVVRGKVDDFGTAIGTGRRKTAVARVRVREGNGQFVVNDRPMEEYFPFIRDRRAVLAPLDATGMTGQVDVWVRVSGGGPTGQSGAVVLGIARALQAKDAGLHHSLSEGGYLTRDGRMVERKKYGRRKARRSFQFSKR
jgi:small subunit ribosomal protein S9